MKLVLVSSYCWNELASLGFDRFFLLPFSTVWPASQPVPNRLKPETNPHQTVMDIFVLAVYTGPNCLEPAATAWCEETTETGRNRGCTGWLSGYHLVPLASNLSWFSICIPKWNSKFQLVFGWPHALLSLRLTNPLCCQLMCFPFPWGTTSAFIDPCTFFSV
jgi:hypothetical protein